MSTTSTTLPAPSNSVRASIIPSTDPEPRPDPERARGPRAGRILIADDEHLAALSVNQCLRELGFTTIGPAHDGEHAVELGFANHPDLALLDVRMADDFDGVDAARLLFEELRIPTVIVSAYSDARQVAESTIPGVFGYVVKPVTCEQLRAAIEIAWARVRQSDEQEREIRRLRNSLEERKTVELAKWALVERLEIDEGAALRHLRKLAKAQGQSLVDVARTILRP